MMGVEVRGPTIMYGDNLSVIGAGKPDAKLNKKCHMCSFAMIREACAASIAVLVYKPSTENRSDALTKALAPHVHYKLMAPLLLDKEEKK